MKELQETIKIYNSPELQKSIRIANSPEVQQAYQALKSVNESIPPISKRYIEMSVSISDALRRLGTNNILNQFRQTSYTLTQAMQSIAQMYSQECLRTSFQQLGGVLSDYNLMYYYSDEMSEEEIIENEEINSKIITELFDVDTETNENTGKKESLIITLSPVNDAVLRYLSEHPEAFYQLSGTDFENVMTEIYSKLGYKVERTQSTRDGGKDIIIRKPDILGDFIYYVECKKYASKRHIGVGIIKNLVGTVLADRVNGGILATTSYFTTDAKKFISDNKYEHQIQMHDYNVIRRMLNQVV